LKKRDSQLAPRDSAEARRRLEDVIVPGRLSHRMALASWFAMEDATSRLNFNPVPAQAAEDKA
jgi:hypothetical protein